VVPIYLLDTDLDENSGWDRGLTDHLYGGDTNYRLQQEIVLGMGGVRMAHALGLRINVYHMNEGHAALLTLALLESQLGGGPEGAATDSDIEIVRRKCVFTTHTPVPAGHDRFSTEQAIRILGGERTARLEKLGCFRDGLLNMTLLALRFSRYANGVAMKHGKVSQAMFPEFSISSITNGVHAPRGSASRWSACWTRMSRRGGGTICICATRSTCRRRRCWRRTRGPRKIFWPKWDRGQVWC
jgi:glycogen phosphorylase